MCSATTRPRSTRSTSSPVIGLDPAIDATDLLDMSDSMADLLFVGGIALGTDTADVVLPGALVAGSTNIAFDTRTIS